MIYDYLNSMDQGATSVTSSIINNFPYKYKPTLWMLSFVTVKNSPHNEYFIRLCDCYTLLSP